MQFLCLILAFCFSSNVTGKTEIELKSFNLNEQAILNNHITFDSKINGKGETFKFDQKNSQIKIDQNTSCILENITLCDFNFDYIKLEENSQIFFGKNVKIILDNQVQNLNYKITFLENAQICSNKNKINLQQCGTIKIEKELDFYNTQICTLGLNPFDLQNENSILRLNESGIEMKNNLEFLQGKIIIQNDSKISGSFSFNYSSTAPIEILKNSKLKISQNLKLSYKPKIIDLSESSVLEIKDCQIDIWHEDFALNNGSFFINGQAKMNLNPKLLEKTICSLNNLFSSKVKTEYLSRISRIKFDKLETE